MGLRLIGGEWGVWGIHRRAPKVIPGWPIIMIKLYLKRLKEHTREIRVIQNQTCRVIFHQM